MRAFLENQFPKLLDILYSAAIDPTQWPTFFRALCSAFDHASGTLYLYDVESSSALWTVMVNHDPQYAASFQEYFVGLNPYQTKNLLLLPPGEIRLATETTPKEAVEKTEFYNDWMRPQGISSDHPAVSLMNNGRQVALLAIAPPRWDDSRVRRAYQRRLDVLVPHLVRAIRLNQELSSVQAIGAGVSAALDALSQSAILIDRAGRPLLLNKTAESLLADPRGALTINSFGHLVARQSGFDLAAIIARTERKRAASGPLKLKATSKGADQNLWVIPVPAQPLTCSEMTLSLAEVASNRPAALVLCAPSRSDMAISSDAIAAVVGLTRAEAKLAAALVAGYSLADYAREIGLSRNTLRNQLASIFSKTGTGRQTELVALIVRSLSGS